MEFLEIALSMAWKVTLILGCLAMSYAIASTLVSIIYKDILNKKETSRLIKENIDLKEKINQLEIELVDKKLAEEYNNNRTKNWVLVCFSCPREKSLGFFRLVYEKCLTY